MSTSPLVRSTPAGTAPSDTAPAATTHRRFKWGIYGVRFAILAGFLLAWEAASGRIIDDFFVSRPSEIWQAWWEWLSDGALWYNASSTLRSATFGFVAGSLAVIVVGYVLEVSPRLAEILEPFITAIYTLPKIATVPLFAMWLGIGRPLQVAICGLVVFFQMFYNTYYGVKDVPRELFDAVKIIGGSRWDVATKVWLPSAPVWVIAGLKLSVPQAFASLSPPRSSPPTAASVTWWPRAPANSTPLAPSPPSSPS
ncbi:ABC transporter permease [Rhodococcus opacus]|uniref:ABC transporter permease n=1 Tax=Rhodococcus opacus TaxID=37919 RepID=UPI000FFB4D91|nr:ABC transporter permease subunit [Rhodococcus opacus]